MDEVIAAALKQIKETAFSGGLRIQQIGELQEACVLIERAVGRLAAAGMLKPSPETSDELDAVKRDRDFWRAQVMDEDGPLLQQCDTFRQLLIEGEDLAQMNHRKAAPARKLFAWGERVHASLEDSKWGWK